MPETRDILKKIRRLELHTRRLVESAFGGQYHSVFKGRGMNFEDVRAYMPGDEVRFIDRNVTARTGDLHVKNFTEERELTVVLVIDVSASGSFGSVAQSKRELAAEVASLVAFSAIGNRDKVGLLLFAEGVELFLPPRQGRSHVLRLIREVLYYQPRGRGTNIAAALDYLNKVILRRAVVFLLSDFQAPDFARPLAVTGRRHDLVAISVVDPLEQALPDIGRVSLEDAETGAILEINTSDHRVRSAFAQAAAARRQELMTQFRRAGVDQITLQNGQDYLPALRAFFQQRERRLARR
jgi:uncharacterized protein (DUF58 family)